MKHTALPIAWEEIAEDCAEIKVDLVEEHYICFSITDGMETQFTCKVVRQLPNSSADDYNLLGKTLRVCVLGDYENGKIPNDASTVSIEIEK